MKAGRDAQSIGQAADPSGCVHQADTGRRWNWDGLLASIAEESGHRTVSRAFDQALFSLQSRYADYIDTRRGASVRRLSRLAEAVRQLQSAQDTRAVQLQ